MKIAILGTRGIPARYGGFETFAERLAIGLVAHGCDVTVFCESGEIDEPCIFHGVKLRYVPAPRLGPLQTILYDARCLWAARNGYDVVYMLGYGAAPFCLIPRLWGTKVWINPDGLEWERAKWGLVARSYLRLMEWAALHSADHIIADAEAIAASLTARHGKLSNCTVIPYGCDVIDTPPAAELLLSWNLIPRSYYLAVCRLEPENHVLEILQAFQKSRSTKQLIVVGNHLAKSKYVARLREVRDTRIRMIGTVYDTSKLTCLRYHAFAYLHGHSVGGTNPSLLEAMGCGNLIIAHNNLFNRETVESCGLYFSDIVELSRAINCVEQEEDDYGQLREATRSRARNKYNWPDIIKKYIEILAIAATKSERKYSSNL
ncbi:MAG: DUF1972 domain-containing protein [Acidobacteriaceae bacterium]|nr:DUF1972 domain-containing protein [Acidobacteriaceae bacterium]